MENGSSLYWKDIQSAFDGRIYKGAVINVNYTHRRKFLQDADDMVHSCVNVAINEHNFIKINTTFETEFELKGTIKEKSFDTPYCILNETLDLRRWYSKNVILETLNSLNEFEEESDWKLHRILRLIINVYAVQSTHNSPELLSKPNNMHNAEKYYCERCHNYFNSQERLEIHDIDCKVMNNCEISLPTEEKKFIRFKNFSREERVPFVVYANFECLRTNVDADEDKPLRAFQRHRPFSVGYYIHNIYDETRYVYQSYSHESKCVEWFVDEMYKFACQAYPILEKSDSRSTIPVVLHNLSKYHANFIIEQLVTKFEDKIEVIVTKNNKYLSFTKFMPVPVDNKGRVYTNLLPGYRVYMRSVPFRFIDSFKLFKSNLDELVSYLDKSKLCILRRHFSSGCDENFNLFIRKFIFPHDYLTSYEKLRETELPERDAFSDALSDNDISDNDYQHVVNVWERFSINTLGEYSDLYLKRQVLLLADIFENFRTECLENYKLDPAHYFSISGFAWDVMLKHTNVELQLLTDIDMYMFVERGIRGGLTQCSHRYAHANNGYMSTYDPLKPSTYLMFFDLNNSYGWAMSQRLPQTNFQWVDEQLVREFDVHSIPENGPIGFILEVDLEYPRELHDSHADLPFCSVRDKPPGKRESKLLASLYSKKRYVVYYRYLKQCLQHGLRLTKIHRILKFQQSYWLRDYINLNTEFRKNATNDFQKNLFKLMNNVVYGKTIEDVRKYRNVRLVTQWENGSLGDGAGTLVARSNFCSCTIFSENLVAIEFKKENIMLNKHVYAGMCILDISKMHLYDFHYNYMRWRLPGKCKVLYTDTDSLIYKLECEDVYEILKQDIERFDTSDYDENNPYNIPRMNKKVIGLMKDENNGKIMIEFVGLKAKTYALRVSDGEGRDDIIKTKVCGIQEKVKNREIEFADFKKCLNDNTVKIVTENSIRSEKHKVYTIKEPKIVLTPGDSKRYIVPLSNYTLPWGHYIITE